MKKGNVADGLVYHAGFPNAGEDRETVGLSLDQLMVGHRASTYFWRIVEPVPELGWAANTLVVVDRSLVPRHGDLVVAVVEESFVLCRMHNNSLRRLDGQAIDRGSVSVWGVATFGVQPLR
jgi:SOS-response transcriptional repressor LexA